MQVFPSTGIPKRRYTKSLLDKSYPCTLHLSIEMKIIAEKYHKLEILRQPMALHTRKVTEAETALQVSPNV